MLCITQSKVIGGILSLGSSLGRSNTKNVSFIFFFPFSSFIFFDVIETNSQSITFKMVSISEQSIYQPRL